MSKWIGALMITAGLVGFAWFLVKRHKPGKDVAPIERDRRSVLIITMDTTRSDQLEPYGVEDVATPNLASFAEQGIVFEQAYSVAPITLVAHSSIMTGLYPPQHQVRNNGIHRVSDNVVTLAEHLKQQGYRTAAFVSAAVLDKKYGLNQGFETYNDDLSTGRERHPRMVPDRPAEFTINEAIQWLDETPQDDNFFLWVHLYDPHAPYSPPAPFRQDYKDRLYQGEIAYMDQQMGRLLNHPRIASDPVVAILGDHGESLGEHEEMTHAILAYDATLHIPFMLRIPGGPAKHRITTEVSQVDLAPTLLDLIDQPPMKESSGSSLVPLLENRVSQMDRYLYGETYLPFYTYGWAKLKTIRKNMWKYIDAPTPELYNLKRDPRELANVAVQNPGKHSDYHDELESLMRSMGNEEEGASMSLDSDTLEQLRSLGYVSVGSQTHIDDGNRPDPKDFIGLHVRLEKARQFIQDDLYEDARSELETVLEIDPGNLAAMSDLAVSLERLNELDRAVEVLLHAIEIDANVPSFHVNLANVEDRRGHTEKALELVDIALALDPRFTEATTKKAMFLYKLGRSEESKQILEEALSQDGDHPALVSAYVQWVLIRNAEWSSAEELLRAGLKRDPFHVLCWRLLGQSLKEQGRVSEAIDAFREGLKRRSDDAELHGLLGVLLASSSDSHQAETHLREAIRLTQGFRSEWHVSLGAWYIDHGKFEQGQQQYRLVLEKEPQNPEARNNQAIAIYQSGDFEKAETQLRDILSHHPKYADAWNNLSAVLVNRESWAEAAKAAETALNINEHIAEAWNNWGICLDELGQSQQALVKYERSLTIDPSYWPAIFNKGLALRHLEKFDEAEEHFKLALKASPNNANLHLELGDFYADSKSDWAKAQDHYNAFLRWSTPNHPRRQQVQDKLLELSLKKHGKNP
ncbi:MAG: tetratricopeptide repeat protein [Acidobacteria bacterium]|nr:tetratricopeptide repeat protein [Acidobacteriota bacterium]